MEDEDLFKMAKVAPLNALKECHFRVVCLESGYHEKLHLRVAEAFAIAYALIRDLHSWRAFARDDFWEKFKKRPKSINPKRPLLNVMVYVFNGTSKNAYSRAQKYASALNKAFYDGVNPEEIVALIERKGGLEAMAHSAATEKRIEREIKYEEDIERLKEYVIDVETANEDDDRLEQQDEVDQDEPDEAHETEDDADEIPSNDNDQQDEGEDNGQENEDDDRLAPHRWGTINPIVCDDDGVPLECVTFWLSRKLCSRLRKAGYGKKARLTLIRLGDSTKATEVSKEPIAGQVVSLKVIR